MPAKSKSQLRTMQAAAHNPMFAKQMGIPKNVAQEMVKATPKGAKLPEKAKAKKARK